MFMPLFYFRLSQIRVNVLCQGKLVFVYNYKGFRKQIKIVKYNQNRIMLVNFNKHVQIILIGLQLAIYFILSSIAAYKMFLSKRYNAKFLLAFYFFTLLDCLTYSSMMIYQIVTLVFDQQLHMIILVIINVYSMILEAIIISLLSFYWKETEATLRGSGLEGMKSVSDIKNQLKVKGSLLGFWFLIYTAFVVYSVVTNNEINNQIYKDICYFGGQGFTTFLLIWANFSQVLNAKQFSFTLKRYQNLVSYKMNKRKFRCIYWIATSISFLRLIYLIIAAIFFRIQTESEQSQWVGMFIYTATGIIPLSTYLYSFQVTQQKQRASFSSFNDIESKSQKQKNAGYEPVIFSPYQKKNQKQLRQSFNETELSNSCDSRGI